MDGETRCMYVCVLWYGVCQFQLIHPLLPPPFVCCVRIRMYTHTHRPPQQQQQPQEEEEEEERRSGG
jgi:hypothetical protein